MFDIKISVKEIENQKIDVRGKWDKSGATDQEMIMGRYVLLLLDLLMRNKGTDSRTQITTDNIEDLDKALAELDEKNRIGGTA